VTNITAERPDAGEYAPYYEKYISLVPAGDVVETLRGQLDDTLALLNGLSEAEAASRYAPDKWSVKEVVGHVLDTERIFSHRALRFARNDQTPLPGFEQDDYVRTGDFGRRTLVDLAEEFAHVRRANISLLRALDEEAWLRRGAANDNEVSVRALAYIMAGHVIHHVQIIRTRYL
jgi:hypothetical protein